MTLVLIDSLDQHLYLTTPVMNIYLHISYFSYACKTEGEKEISRLFSTLCVNCLSAIPEYSRFILNCQVSFKL